MQPMAGLPGQCAAHRAHRAYVTSGWISRHGRSSDESHDLMAEWTDVVVGVNQAVKQAFVGCDAQCCSFIALIVALELFNVGIDTLLGNSDA